MTLGVVNLVTQALVLRNEYAARRLRVLLTGDKSINEVVYINPVVEYY